jgi:DNA-binding response OmpR family regulator
LLTFVVQAARLHGAVVRVLFLSGHTLDRPLPIGAAFLQKPFTPSELTAMVREALDSPPRPDAADASW